MIKLAAGSGPAAVGLGGVVCLLMGNVELGIILFLFSGFLTLGWAAIMKM